MSRAESPFDPFSVVDDDEEEETNNSRANIKSTGSDSSNTSKTTNTRKSKQSKQSKQNIDPHLLQQDNRYNLASVQESTGTKPLPPKLRVRLTLHEEVSSMAVGDGGSMSQLSIEGKVTARVESSNAKENAPFGLSISGPMTKLANIKCKEHCEFQSHGEDDDELQYRVDIPKSQKAGFEILNYSMSVQTQNMPILVQAKAAIKENKCRVIVQIRSNLSNVGDLSNFTVIVAIPTTLVAETVKITKGDNGVWDSLKRIVTWKIGHLPHGESCLVSAEADLRLSPAVANLVHDNPFNNKVVESKIHCPVLVRCLSEVDQVSDLTLTATPLQNERGVATIVQNRLSSYQLLHRVGKTGV